MHRILIIGTGSIGERHLRCFRATGRAEVGFCETREPIRREIAQRYELTEAFDSVEAALRSSHWDAAVIATPAPSHLPIATKLASQNVHLMIEKPLSTTVDGAADLIELVRARKLVAHVAFVYRVHPLVTRLREMIRSEQFGRPVQFTVVAGQNFPHYRPAYRDIYYAHRAQGGGAIQDTLPHLLNAGEWLLGPAALVGADAAHQVLEGVEVEDTVSVIARHDGGKVLATYVLNQHQAPNETSLTIACTKGTVRLEMHENRLSWMTEVGGAWQRETMPPMQRDEWYVRQANHFLDALERKCEPACSIDEALQTLRVTLAILAACPAVTLR